MYTREETVDYEKLRIIRERAATSKDEKVKSLVAQLEEHMKVFLDEKDFISEKIRADVEKGHRLIEELSVALSAPVQ